MMINWGIEELMKEEESRKNDERRTMKEYLRWKRDTKP
jgi:hypothetical protein